MVECRAVLPRRPVVRWRHAAPRRGVRLTRRGRAVVLALVVLAAAGCAVLAVVAGVAVW